MINAYSGIREPTTAELGAWFNQNTTNANMDFLSGSYPVNTTWMDTSSSSVGSSWIKPSRLNDEQLANIWNNPTNNNTGLNDPWGLSESQVIDDDPGLPPIENISQSDSTEIAEEVAEAGETAEETLEAVEAASSSTPWGIAAIINQQLGSAVSQANVEGLRQQVNSDYSQNIQQHGLNVGLNADIIRLQQESSISRQMVGGSLGSFLGPFGALIGQAIAGYNSVNQQALQTAGSFGGWVNPLQTNIVASQTTAGDPGQQIQEDNVDTTNE